VKYELGFYIPEDDILNKTKSTLRKAHDERYHSRHCQLIPVALSSDLAWVILPVG
jgi:hypothetical protein